MRRQTFLPPHFWCLEAYWFCVMRCGSAVRFLPWLLSAALVLLSPMAAHAKRVAFVVGVNDYVHLDGAAQLRRAINDAQGVGKALQALGFHLMLVENARRSEFNAEWQQFLGAIEPGDEVAFFYSGHGVEIDGQNFLVPADIPKISFGRQEQIKRESLSVSELLLDLRRRNPRVSLVILDACRDHPFAPSEWKAGEKPGGLARMDAPRGTFVMYSAWAGERALDRLPSGDPDPTHSVYTRKLLPLLTTPGLNLTELAKRVRQEVHMLTATVSHPQTPAYYDGILGDYCLAGCDGDAVAAASARRRDVQPAAIAQEDAGQHPVRSFEGHTKTVHAVAFSPDGRRILSGSQDHTLKLWDLETASQLRNFRGHVRGVIWIGTSPDGRSVFSGSLDSTVKIWDAATGTELRSLAGHSSGVTASAVSADGRFILSGGKDGALKFWDVETQGRRWSLGAFSATDVDKRLKGESSRGVAMVAISPDGHLILSSGFDDGFKLRGAETGEELASFTGHSKWVTSATFSNDGRQVLSGSHDHTLRLWDTRTAKELRRFRGHTDAVYSVALSPDGQYALSGSADRSVRLWDIRTGKELRSFAGHSGEVYSVAFSPDGRYALSGGADNSIKLWDLSGWLPPRVPGIAVTDR